MNLSLSMGMVSHTQWSLNSSIEFDATKFLESYLSWLQDDSNGSLVKRTQEQVPWTRSGSCSPGGEDGVMNFGRPVGPSGRGPLDSQTTLRRLQSFNLIVERAAKTLVYFAVLVKQSKFFFLITQMQWLIEWRYWGDYSFKFSSIRPSKNASFRKE